MCSSPKGSRTKPHLSSKVDSTFSDMSSTEYSDMVRRANESYEQRQQELSVLRKNMKKTPPLTQKKHSHISFYEKIKNVITQLIFTHQLDEK